MAELEELEQEELDKNLLEISGPETVPLPNVPSIALPSKPGEYFCSESWHTHDAMWWVIWCGQLDLSLGSELPKVENQVGSVVMAPETMLTAYS